MTRDEAKKKINIHKSEVYPYGIIDNVDSVIDDIFDSLEDRNCSNCKFVGLTGYGNLKCENISSVICNKMTDYKISCTEWELNNEKI